MRIIRHFFVVLLLGVLSACGGGGTIGGTDNEGVQYSVSADHRLI